MVAASPNLVLDRAVGDVIANAARHGRTRVAVGLDIDDPGTGDGTRDAVVRVGDDGPDTSGTGGAGLGLSITSEVVSRHGGTITEEGSPLVTAYRHRTCGRFARFTSGRRSSG